MTERVHRHYRFKTLQDAIKDKSLCPRGTKLAIYTRNNFDTKSEIQAAFSRTRDTRDNLPLYPSSWPSQVSISRTYKTQFLPLSKHKSIPSPLPNKSDNAVYFYIHMRHKSTYLFNSQGLSLLKWVTRKTTAVFYGFNKTKYLLCLYEDIEAKTDKFFLIYGEVKNGDSKSLD